MKSGFKRNLLVMSGLILFVLGMGITAHAQHPTDELEVIDATNMERIREIANLGYGAVGIALWSEDGQTLYYGTSVGTYAFDISNPATYTVLDEDAVTFPPLPRFDAIDINQPVAVSPDGNLTARLTPLIDDERKALLMLTDSISGAEITQVLIDSPLVFQRYSADIVHPQFTEDGRLLYPRDNSIYQWDFQTDTETLMIEHVREQYSANFTDIRINPQGTYAATYTIDSAVSITNKTLTIYDLSTQPATTIYSQFFPPLDRWHSVAISPDGQYVATGGSNNNVRVWTLADRGLTFRDDNPPDEMGEQAVVDLVYSRDGEYLLGSEYHHAFIRDAATGEELATIYGLPGTGFKFFSAVAVHPYENVVAFSGANGTVQLWNIDELIARGETYYEDVALLIQAHGSVGPVVDVNFSSDGTLIASASWDGTVTLWDYATQEQVRAYNLGEKVWSAVFSPDGATLATSSEDGKVTLWDIYGETSVTLDELLPRNEYDNPHIVALTFNHDGSLLAGSGSSGDIYLWHPATGQRVTVQERTGNRIRHLEFSTDNKMLITASQDTTVRIWGIPTDG